MSLESQSALGTPFGAARPIRELSRPGCNVIERVELGAVLCSVSINRPDPTSDLSKVVGIELPTQPGKVTLRYRHWAIWLSPCSWLLVCPEENERKLAMSINAAFMDRHIFASAYADHLCWLMLDGTVAEDMLRQGGFISLSVCGLPAGHAKRTLLAGIPVIVFRIKETCWALMIERSRVHYFVDWLRALNTRPGV